MKLLLKMKMTCTNIFPCITRLAVITKQKKIDSCDESACHPAEEILFEPFSLCR